MISLTLALFIIIALEGYIILSAELLAMRQTIPFVGTGTDTVSIIIAAVLIPLAFGYQSGGNFNRKNAAGKFRSVRHKLLKNIIIAAAILLPGLSYLTTHLFFYALHLYDINNTLTQITIYCAVFMVVPIYLLGQTVPLIGNYFSKHHLAQITGRILFLSTLGSFCGSLLTTLVLMQIIGVHHTVTLLFALMSIPVIFLSTKRTRSYLLTMLGILGASACLNSTTIMDTLNIVKDNKYSTIMVFPDEDGTRHLYINNNDSSKYSDTGEKHHYAEFVESITIEAIPESAPPKDVLIIGAGGFTFGHDDLKNNFIYIDIDKDLKEVSEKYLLKEKLQDNKTFYPLPARAYLNQTDKKFDIILLDAYLGGLSIPEHLVTKEFFIDIKNHIKKDGVVVANFILSPNFNNRFAKNIDNTFREVFPYVSRHNPTEKWHLWSTSKTRSANFVYIYKHIEDTGNKEIFHDKPATPVTEN